MGRLTLKARWRAIMCRLSRHRRYQVIQTFGAAQHVGCPDCRRTFAVHHGMRAWLPWDADFASLYDDMGYDTKAATRKWIARLETPNAE